MTQPQDPHEARIAELKRKVGGDFGAWVALVEEAFEDDEDSSQRSRTRALPERPTGWDDAGPWQGALWGLLFRNPRKAPLLFSAFSKQIEQAWATSVENLIDVLNDVQVLDPSFNEMPAQEVLFDPNAESEVEADGDAGLIAEYRRLKASYYDSTIRAGSGAIIEHALALLGSLSEHLLADYIFAGLEAIRSREHHSATLELTQDEARAFAEMYMTSRTEDELVLTDRSMTEAYELVGKRKWRKRTDYWNHVFVGPDTEYEIDIAMEPGQSMPTLVQVKRRDSPADRYQDLISKGSHDRLPPEAKVGRHRDEYPLQG